MTDIAISAMPADTYAPGLLIPAVDETKPAGQKNVEIPAGALAPVRSVAGRTGDVVLEVSDIAGLVQGTNFPHKWFHPGPVSNTGTYEMRIAFNEPTRIPANLAGTIVNPKTPPAAPALYEFSATLSGTRSVLGTLSISTAGALTLPTFATVTANSGDGAELKPVGTPDTSMADVAWALMFIRLAAG